MLPWGLRYRNQYEHCGDLPHGASALSRPGCCSHSLNDLGQVPWHFGTPVLHLLLRDGCDNHFPASLVRVCYSTVETARPSFFWEVMKT